MKNKILFFVITGLLILNGCKKESFYLKDIFIDTIIATDKIIDTATTSDTRTSFVQVEEKKNINDGIHKSDNASLTVELENKIDSIINQIGELQ